MGTLFRVEVKPIKRQALIEGATGSGLNSWVKYFWKVILRTLPHCRMDYSIRRS